MWDSASYMAAMTAARELGIIDKAEFDRRMLKLLATLNKLDLFRNELPNKAYNTITGQKVNYQNKRRDWLLGAGHRQDVDLAEGH